MPRMEGNRNRKKNTRPEAARCARVESYAEWEARIDAQAEAEARKIKRLHPPKAEPKPHVEQKPTSPIVERDICRRRLVACADLRVALDEAREAYTAAEKELEHWKARATCLEDQLAKEQADILRVLAAGGEIVKDDDEAEEEDD